MKQTDMRFSERVKSVRTKLGFSQHQLAAELNLSCAAVNRWEKGNRSPRSKTAAWFYSFCAARQIVFDDIPEYLFADFIPPKKEMPQRKDRRKARYKSQDEARIHRH